MVRDGTLELRSEVHEVHTQTHRHKHTNIVRVKKLMAIQVDVERLNF